MLFIQNHLILLLFLLLQLKACELHIPTPSQPPSPQLLGWEALVGSEGGKRTEAVTLSCDAPCRGGGALGVAPTIAKQAGSAGAAPWMGPGLSLHQPSPNSSRLRSLRPGPAQHHVPCSLPLWEPSCCVFSPRASLLFPLLRLQTGQLLSHRLLGDILPRPCL